MSSQDEARENDDFSENDLYTGLTTTREGISVLQIEQAIKQSQLRESRLSDQVKALSIDNGVKDLSPNAGVAKSKRPRSVIPDAIKNDVKEITLLGKHYGIMICPWASPSIFKRHRPTMQVKGTARYLNNDTREEGLIAELYDFVPEKYHSAVKSLTKFSDLFRSGISKIRSSVVYIVRPLSTELFDNLDAKYFKSEFDKNDSAELRRLIGWNTKKNKFTHWAPILFPNQESDKVDLRYAFRNPALPLILKVALFGPSSLSTTRKATPKTNGQIWGVTTVTDGAIAFAAIMARHLLSGDKEFVEKGSATNIEYYSDFWAYRQFLASVAEGPRKQLISWYNSKVFVDKPTSFQLGSADDTEKVCDDDIAAFNAGIDDDEDLIDEVEDNDDDAMGNRESTPNISTPHFGAPFQSPSADSDHHASMFASQRQSFDGLPAASMIASLVAVPPESEGSVSHIGADEEEEVEGRRSSKRSKSTKNGNSNPASDANRRDGKRVSVRHANPKPKPTDKDDTNNEDVASAQKEKSKSGRTVRQNSTILSDTE